MREAELKIRRRLGVGVLAALAVLVFVGVAPGLFDADPEATGSTPSTSTTSAAVSTTEEETQDAQQVASPSTTLVAEDLSDLPPAPWEGAFLSPEQVDPVLLADWEEAANRGYCSLLAPADMGPEGEEAVAREAGFGPDDEWFVAWDNPDGPGMTGDGEACEDCGRSAFGIQGGSALAEPQQTRWSDGSGMTVNWSEHTTYADGHARVMADIEVAGQPCRYSLWSSLGERHLLWFVDQLRFVEGHYSEPIAVESGDVRVIEEGTPDWSKSAPLGLSDLDPLFIEVFASGPEGLCPLVAFEDLGPELGAGEIRTVGPNNRGVAWDNPGGPGQDGQNLPCSDCGRGVVGFLGGSPAPSQDPPDRPYRVEWEDGSVATYGYEGLIFNQIPSELIDSRDPATGEPVTPPLHAWVEMAGPDCVYEFWTHLGEEHLQYLLTQMRFVDIDG